ncbi:MAG: PilZ domain-containing protein [Pseudobdellovibrio sp.]
MKNWILLDNLTKIQSQPISTQELEAAILRLPKSELGRYFLWTTGWNNWQPLQEYLESDQKTLSVAIQMNTQTAQQAINQFHNDSLSSKSNNTNKDQEGFVLIDNTMTKSANKLSLQLEHTKTVAVDNITQATTSHDLKLAPIKPETQINDYTSDQIKKTDHVVNIKNINFKDINTPYRNRSERHEFKIEILLINKRNKTFRSFSKNISLSGTLLEDNIPNDFYDDSFDLVVVNRQPTNSLNSRVQVKATVVQNDGYSQRITFVNVNPVQKQRLKDLLNDYINQQKKKKTG